MYIHYINISLTTYVYMPSINIGHQPRLYEGFQTHINLSLSEMFLLCLIIVRDFINYLKTMTNQRAKSGELREVLIRNPLVRSAISAC